MTTMGLRIWAGQFVTALTVNDNNNDGIDFMDCILHCVAMGWKVLAAIIPTKMHGGWPCFGVALVLIGLCALISDCLHLWLPRWSDNVVTSISIVALGTSLRTPCVDATVKWKHRQCSWECHRVQCG